MRWIKFTMSKGSSISLPADKAEKIIEDERQLLAVYDDAGNWTGKTINKAYVVSTEFDLEKEKMEAERERMATPKLNESKPTPEQIAASEVVKKKIRGMFNIKK